MQKDFSLDYAELRIARHAPWLGELCDKLASGHPAEFVIDFKGDAKAATLARLAWYRFGKALRSDLREPRLEGETKERLRRLLGVFNEYEVSRVRAEREGRLVFVDRAASAYPEAIAIALYGERALEGDGGAGDAS